eukprot:8485917-Pyramimonas_sp.AAC.1
MRGPENKFAGIKFKRKHRAQIRALRTVNMRRLHCRYRSSKHRSRICRTMKVSSRIEVRWAKSLCRCVTSRSNYAHRQRPIG